MDTIQYETQINEILEEEDDDEDFWDNEIFEASEIHTTFAVEEDTEEEDLVIPALDTTSAFKLKDAPIIAIPTTHLNDLFKSSGVVNVVIHNVMLSLDKGSLEKLGVNTEDPCMIDMVVKSLMEKLTPEEALELRRNQQVALKHGIQFKIEGTEVKKSTANFTVLVPELCSRIKIETLNKEIDIEKNLTVLNEVKSEFQSEARGLQKVLKNTTAAEMLNYIQTLSPAEELKFYFDVLSRFPKDSATAIFSLSIMRHIMQYSFNVDNLMLKAILTEVLDRDE